MLPLPEISGCHPAGNYALASAGCSNVFLDVLVLLAHGYLGTTLAVLWFARWTSLPVQKITVWAHVQSLN